MGMWAFEEQRSGAVRRDPNEGEMFKTEQTSEREYSDTDTLVREILQNAIDASAGAGPVRVRLSIHEANDAPPNDRLAPRFARICRC